MNAIILYGSRYGAARRYAEALAAKTGITAEPYRTKRDISGYDTIIYFGSLYAGRVTGLAQTAARLSVRQKVVIATVGLANPDDNANADTIRAAVRRQVPDGVYAQAKLFFLRGGINYKALSLRHRVMMWAFRRILLKTPPEERTAETKAILDTYGQTVDFVDLGRLDEIEKAML
ncbi:MAG TPA: hypothetical protein IAC74_00220 [Candidatus Aphodoplasma excrementigallinarum]|uniref:Flavodoxin domain-containing protein n=1 Tax=Candidatus Aphodoplasma excrementigallinarum TaxID=2840673 RepID=A0A9D1NG71_9FIRM|nr:hypothetical protein [Candidatus Aphodoplasma excrementigallinarum]